MKLKYFSRLAKDEQRRFVREYEELLKRDERKFDLIIATFEKGISSLETKIDSALSPLSVVINEANLNYNALLDVLSRYAKEQRSVNEGIDTLNRNMELLLNKLGSVVNFYSETNKTLKRQDEKLKELDGRVTINTNLYSELKSKINELKSREATLEKGCKQIQYTLNNDYIVRVDSISNKGAHVSLEDGRKGLIPLESINSKPIKEGEITNYVTPGKKVYARLKKIMNKNLIFSMKDVPDEVKNKKIDEIISIMEEAVKLNLSRC